MQEQRFGGLREQRVHGEAERRRARYQQLTTRALDQLDDLARYLLGQLFGGMTRARKPTRCPTLEVRVFIA